MLANYERQVIDLEDKEDDNDIVLRLAMRESEALYAATERKRFENFSIEDYNDASADEIIKILATIELSKDEVCTTGSSLVEPMEIDAHDETLQEPM